MSREWTVGVGLLAATLTLASCRRVGRGGGGGGARRVDAGVVHREGKIDLPGPRHAQVLALVPGHDRLALLVWQDATGIWTSSATASQRIAEPDPEAVAAWDGERVHVLGNLERLALTPDGSVVVRGPGVPGKLRIAVAAARGLVAIRERCAGPRQAACTRFADVSIDGGDTWLPEQQLKLLRGEPLGEVVGFLDAGVPTWVEASVPAMVRHVDAAGVVRTDGELPVRPGSISPGDDVAYWVATNAPRVAACPGSPARMLWAGGGTKFGLHVGTVAKVLADMDSTEAGDPGGVFQLYCAGDELLLTITRGPLFSDIPAPDPSVLASHDGGATWLDLEIPMPDAPIFGVVGAPPHARLYFGKVGPEAPSADGPALDEAGLRYLRQGRLHSVDQSVAGFVGTPQDTGIPDNSLLGVGHRVRFYDMEAWRILPLPGGGALLVWVEPIAPTLQAPDSEALRALQRVGWRYIE
ncbi:MAG: hypothetical protein IT370_05660 [Deltaproteobacteria bacterium]|nr:hypothetical protein [Deltaproteobacteria bacterium]